MRWFWRRTGEAFLSDEHFTVDGTLIEAAASLKNFKPRETDRPSNAGGWGNPSVELSRGAPNQRDAPERDGPRGEGGQAGVTAHALMENRNGLLVDFLVSEATGAAERDAVPVLLAGARERRFHPRTLGGDKGYDTRGCVGAMRACRVTPHVAQNTSGRSSATNGRTTRHRRYALSQRLRKRVEEIFGWMKTVGGFRRTRYRGLNRTGLAGYLVGTAYNLVQMARLMTAEMPVPQAVQAA